MQERLQLPFEAGIVVGHRYFNNKTIKRTRTGSQGLRNHWRWMEPFVESFCLGPVAKCEEWNQNEGTPCYHHWQLYHPGREFR